MVRSVHAYERLNINNTGLFEGEGIKASDSEAAEDARLEERCHKGYVSS